MPEIKLEILEVPMSDIYMDINLNCRGNIAPIDVQDLARDIEKNGLMSPVIIQEYNKEYAGKYYKWRLIAGFRRFTAHKILNRTEIRATISTITDEKDARLLNLRENLLRQELNILQEAKAVEHLHSYGMTMQEISHELEKSFGWVQVRMYLLQLPAEIQEQAAAGFITQHQVRDLKNLPTKEAQFEAVRKIKEAKEKGEKTPVIREKKAESAMTKRQRKRKEIFIMMEHIQDHIGNNFGTRCLAWAAGQIPDSDIFREIKKLAEEKGKIYVIPNQSAASLAGIDINAHL